MLYIPGRLFIIELSLISLAARGTYQASPEAPCDFKDTDMNLRQRKGLT